MGGKSPSWESELWSYISSGDGMRCRLYSQCPARRGNSFCAEDNREELRRLFDSDHQFDPGDYGFIKFQGGVTYRLAILIERLAQRQLKKGKIRYPPVPAELIMLADGQYPIEVRFLSLKACHAATWRLGDRWVIQLESKCSSARNRFNLFHEAFHILAHCNSVDRPVFNRRGFKQGSFNELLADYFAICILMPREWVKEKWAEFGDRDKMALAFEVPPSAMWFRLRELGLV